MRINCYLCCMKERIILSVLASVLFSWVGLAQVDTSGLYGERKDSLNAAVYTGQRAGNYLSRNKDLRVEVISAEGLLKMACCNVAEIPWRSFRERVLAGLAAAGRRAEISGIHHEPALDFPVAPGQEPYLKMVWLQL